MTTEQSLDALANDFWSRCAHERGFPRNVERAIAMTLPLAVAKMPQLHSRNLSAWLRHRKVPVLPPAECKDLMGCLVAYRGYGLIFVCGTDELEEQRLTIAHEAAHFLLDYLLPRQQVIAALGDGIADVLDGLRPAKPTERASAVLSHVRLGPHVHIFPRREGEENSPPHMCIETRADELAIELVAPRSQVISLYRQLSMRGMGERKLVDELARYFGLPNHAFDSLIARMDQRRPVSFVREAMPRIRGSS
jgi:Zn-dependent peptidase ImmA (M78 family)